MATEHDDSKVDWSKTTFEGSRDEQLRRAQAMTVRERLEALDRMTALAERMSTMPRHPPERTEDQFLEEPRPRYDSARPVNEIILAGCSPTPLAGYLKALGVLRLLSAKYPETRGGWRGDRFVLHSSLNEHELLDYFGKDYQPTPVTDPWNGGSGFYYQERKSSEKDPVTGKKKKLGIRDQATAATKVIDAILKHGDARLDAYKQVLRLARSLVKSRGLESPPDSGAEKHEFTLAIRSSWPEEDLTWLDAALLVTGDRTEFPPLLGTGGNDGNLDFTSNYMQRVIDVVGGEDGLLIGQSFLWLKASLFGTASPSLTKNNIGQFFPGKAGGLNGTNGYEADAGINPWDFVLMIEGSLTFSATTVRRNADDPIGVLSYPFTVRPVGAGSGNLGEGDVPNSRGEIWMPLWSNPACYREVQSLLAEGRVAFGKKPVRDALDFVRAVHQLGGHRGVRSFQRFGLLKRFGNNHLATPLGRANVGEKARSSLLDDLDGSEWLDRFRRFARGEASANRFRSLRKQLEDQLFDLSGREPTSSEMQFLLILLGSIQQSLSTSDKARESVRPIPRLSERWVSADDDTPEYRIAKAIAGIQGYAGDWLPLCAQLFPLHRKNSNWVTAKNLDDVRVCSGSRGRLVELLATLLEKRLWLAERLEMKDKPLSSPAGATLDDVAAFLRDDRMDARIAALLPGLSLCAIPEDTDRGAGEGMLPAAFGLMKLALTPDRILRSVGHLRDNDRVPVPAGMVAQLTAGNHGNRAVAIAWRRLRASGLAPFFTNTVPDLSGIAPDRAAAALLIPLRWSATKALARTLLEEPETQAEPAITE